MNFSEWLAKNGKSIRVYYPDKSDLTRWYYEIAQYLDGDIIDEGAISRAVEEYLQNNPIEVPVSSVNGKVGEVQINADDVGALPLSGGVLDGDLSVVMPGGSQTLISEQGGKAAITLDNEGESSGDPLTITQEDGHLYLSSGQNRYEVYDSGNYNPEAPVSGVESVNGKTGVVILDADSVGALPNTYQPPVNSVNGEAGNVLVTELKSKENPTASALTISANNDSGHMDFMFGGAVSKLVDFTADNNISIDGNKAFSPTNIPPDFYGVVQVQFGSYGDILTAPAQKTTRIFVPLSTLINGTLSNGRCAFYGLEISGIDNNEFVQKVVFFDYNQVADDACRQFITLSSAGLIFVGVQAICGSTPVNVPSWSSFLVTNPSSDVSIRLTQW